MMIRDKAKVILTIFISLLMLSGCSGARKNDTLITGYGEDSNALPVVGAINDSRLSEPLVVAAVFAIPEKKSTEYGELKIKIVSGDGMPLSAKVLSRELEDKGYRIDRIDIAPYIFKHPVVFYAPGLEDNARLIAGEINAKGGIKPLSWKSIYDIIIVSVQK